MALLEATRTALDPYKPFPAANDNNNADSDSQRIIVSVCIVRIADCRERPCAINTTVPDPRFHLYPAIGGYGPWYEPSAQDLYSVDFLNVASAAAQHAVRVIRTAAGNEQLPIWMGEGSPARMLQTRGVSFFRF